MIWVHVESRLLIDSLCRGIVDRVHWMCGAVEPSDAEPLPVGIRNGSKSWRNRRAGRSRRIGRLQQIATVCEQSATILASRRSLQQFVNKVQQIATLAS
jgi:hypothetical protein